MKRKRPMRIILASASPRRRELLEQIGWKFEIQVSNTDERAETDSPHRLVEELSRQKAETVFAALDRGAALVIGADTVVAVDGSILGKPTGREEAVRMLRLLSGRTHQVYTGVTLLYRPGPQETVCAKTFHEVTKVHFYPMTDEEIEAYVATGEPMDKAGAYGIQGVFARYVRGLEGDYFNVVGLPVAKLYQEAKEWLER